MSGQTWQQLASAQREPVFQPPTIFGAANLRQWVRADRQVTQSSGLVAQWDDLSGNGWHYTQSNTAKRPTRPTDPALSGLPVVLLDGVDDQLVSSLLLPRASVSPTTVLMVVNFKANPAIKPLVFNNPGTDPVGSQMYVQIYPPDANPTSISVGNPNDNVFPGPALNKWTVIVIGFSGGTMTDPVRVGAYRSNATAGDDVPNGVSGRKIGGYPGAAVNAALFEMMHVQGIPTDRQLDRYARYVSKTTGGTVLV